MSGLGHGPFNGNDNSIKNVADVARQIMSSSSPQVDMHSNVTPEHIAAAADDVRQNATTLEDRNNIITRHMREIGDENTTTGNVAAFSKEVLRQVNTPRPPQEQ